MLSNHYKEMYDEINNEKVDSKYVFDLVHDYLIHSGFIGTLQAFEEESSFALMKEDDFEAKNEFATLANNTTTNIPRKNTLGADMLLFRSRDRSSSNILSDNIGNLSSRILHTEEIKEVNNEQKEKSEESKDKQCNSHQDLVQKDADDAIKGKVH